MNKKIILGTLVGCLIGATAGYSTTSGTLPFTFTSGTPIIASQINANFQALVTQNKDLAARLDKLEGKNLVAADFVGTYTINNLQNELRGETSSIYEGSIASYASQGTVTLNADGTGVLSSSELGSDLTVYQGYFSNPPPNGRTVVRGRITPHTGSENRSFSWTYANGMISFLEGSFTVVPGGKLLIRSSANSVDNTTTFITLTRKG